MGTWKEGSFVGDRERYVKEIYQKRCKNARKWVSLSIGTPLGNLERIRLLGLSDSRQYIWVPFLAPEDIKILSLGAIWNFGKGAGSAELISDYEAQRARL